MNTPRSIYIVALSVAVVFLCACPVAENTSHDDTDDEVDLTYRSQMRSFVTEIAQYSRAQIPGFIVIPQNGHELFTMSPYDPEGEVATAYLDGIDGIGREDLFYGYTDDNVPTPATISDHTMRFLDIGESSGVQVLAIDYCSDPSFMDDSYNKNFAKSYISFAADHRELDNIPTYPVPIFGENNTDIDELKEAANFLYLINPALYSQADDMITDIARTNYDLIVIDLFYNDTVLSASQVESLKTKANGGKRLVIAYMSIGEAESYRWYWKSDWNKSPPAWLGKENPDWDENYLVHYWDPEWKKIIYGSSDSYLDKILTAGFDGVYLDIIEAYEYFE